MKAVLIHSAARAELDDAMKFYENRARGLGLDLQLRVEHAVIVGGLITGTNDAESKMPNENAETWNGMAVPQSRSAKANRG